MLLEGRMLTVHVHYARLLKPGPQAIILSSQGIPVEGDSHTGPEPVAPAGGGTPALSTAGLTSPTSTAPSQPAAGPGGET